MHVAITQVHQGGWQGHAETEPERRTTSNQFGLAELSWRNSHISWFIKVVKVHEYLLKGVEVNFLMPLSAECFRAPSLAAECFWCRLFRRSIVSLMSKFPWETVSLYNISWSMLHMGWKVIKLAFQRIWSRVFWMFLCGVMIKTLKTTQKARRHAGNWRPLHEWTSQLAFHLPTWLFQFTSIFGTSC